MSPKSVRLTSRSSYIVFTCALATLLISCGDQAEREESLRRFPDSLVGSWVQVYPPAAGKDTLVLNPDGSAHRAGVPIVIQGRMVGERGRVSRWQVGHPFIPKGLCIGAQALYCRNYLLRGDMLAFADPKQTVLIRAGAMLSSVSVDDTVAADRSRYGEVPRASKPHGGRDR